MPDTIKHDAQHQADEFRSGLEKIKRPFEKAGDQLKSNAEEAWEDFLGVVKKHPGKAIGMTLAAGAALGFLTAFSKRRRYSATDQLRDLAGNGVDAWSRVKNGFNDALSTLKEAIDDAVLKFR